LWLVFFFLGHLFMSLSQLSIDLAAMPLLFWVVLAAVVGAMLGSFGGLVAYRLPIMLLHDQPGMNLALPASHCGHCGKPLLWWHNLPLISYWLLKGRCGHCHTPFGCMSFVLELSMASLWAGMVAYQGPSLVAVLWAGFFSVLLILCVIDWQTQLLPDALTLPLMWAGLLLASMNQLGGLSVEASLWGAAGGYTLLWMVAEVFKRTRGVEGMGAGDLKLLAAIGAWLGPWSLLPVIFVSSILHVLMVLAFSKDKHSTFAMGPALALAAALLWVAQGQHRFEQWLSSLA
jgi:prepilin signal peptidase PulO-like enzyme (type II secretory pathway)